MTGKINYLKNIWWCDVDSDDEIVEAMIFVANCFGKESAIYIIKILLTHHGRTGTLICRWVIEKYNVASRAVFGKKK